MLYLPLFALSLLMTIPIRFLLMCIVLRCCQENEAQSIFDLENEIDLSAFAELQPKPLVCVDGQPVSLSAQR